MHCDNDAILTFGILLSKKDVFYLTPFKEYCTPAEIAELNRRAIAGETESLDNLIEALEEAYYDAAYYDDDEINDSEELGPNWKGESGELVRYGIEVDGMISYVLAVTKKYVCQPLRLELSSPPPKIVTMQNLIVEELSRRGIVKTLEDFGWHVGTFYADE